MNARDVLKLCKEQLRGCAGWESDEISKDRKAALDYYFQRARGDEVAGRSAVVSGDISASVEANLAQMLEAFSSDSIADFDALGADDEPQAALETDAVTHFLMKTQNGFIQLATAIKECLLLRNGFVKVWVEKFTQTKTRTFDKVAPVAVEALLAQTGGEKVSYSGGKLTVRVSRTLKKFRAEACEWVYYPKEWPSYDLQECPFVCERHVDTRSDLQRMGFPKAKVDALKAMAINKRDDAQHARNVRSFLPPNTNTPDRSQDQIEWFEAYVLMDVDGDGIAERRYVAFTYEDNAVLANDPATLVPYSVGAVMINPHRLTGISQYDKLRQTQDEHTGLKRAKYDNVNAVTKNRLAYLDGVANVDDVGDGRPNGAIRVKMKAGIADVRQGVMAFAVPDNTANILANEEALKRERSELGGAALDLATGQMQIGGDRMGSQGLDRAYSVMEQLASMMTKIAAATLIRSVYLLAHATLREQWDEPISLKRQGDWVEVLPTRWIVRDRVTVKVGMSPGERARQANALRTMLDAQLALAKEGMDEILIDAQTFYRTLMTWARVSDVRNPEQFWIDPASPRALKAMEAKTKNSQRTAAMRQALLERAVGKEEATVALDKYKHDSRLQYEYWKGVMESEAKEAEIVGHATTELLKGREDGRKEAGTPAKKKSAPRKNTRRARA